MSFVTVARFLSSFSPFARIPASLLLLAFLLNFLVFAPYLVHFFSLPYICSIPHFFSLALFFISLLQFRRPYVNSSARIFSCDHLFLARDSLVSLLARPQAPFITHVPSTQSSSYQCFSSFMEGLFKTPLFAQCELRVDINSGIVFSSV